MSATDYSRCADMKAWKVRKVNHLPPSKLLKETDMRQECLVHAGLASPFAFSRRH